MKIFDKAELFSVIHDYFKVYLPTQKRCSRHTIRSYAKSLEALLDFVKDKKQIPLSKITFEMIDYEMINAFLNDVERRGGSLTTRNHRLYCLRSFYKYATNMHPTVTAFKTEIMNVPVRRMEKAPKVNYLREDEMKALLEQPVSSTEKGLRDKTMLVLLYDSAARIQELLDIRLSDLRLGDISTVMLRGKGSKIRTVPIMAKTTELLRQYIALYHENLPAHSDELLFYAKYGQIRHKMSDENVRRVIHKYAEAAKETCKSMPDNIHPHMFRHSRAMHLYQNGMELVLISQWLGHAQIETTLVYAYADTEMKRKAIESATQGDNILRTKDSSSRYTITDEATLKRLCGLR